MGADGHYYLMRKSEWDAKFPDVIPGDCGCTVKYVLGIQAVCAYKDTEDRDDFDDGKQGLIETLELHRYRYEKASAAGGTYTVQWRAISYLSPPWVASEEAAEIARIESLPEYPYAVRCHEAVTWFKQHAEDHCVWT